MEAASEPLESDVAVQEEPAVAEDLGRTSALPRLTLLESIPVDGADAVSRLMATLQYAMEREKLYRETFEQAPAGVLHTALNGGILRVNLRACALLGYGAAQLRELSFPDLTHPEDLPANVREFKRTLAGEIDGYRLEQRLRRKDQSYLPALVSVSVKRGQRLLPDYAIVVIQDLSAQKQVEANLNAARAELASARDGLQDQVTLLTRRLKESNEARDAQIKEAQDASEARRAAEAGLQAALQAAQAELTKHALTDDLTELANRRSFSRRIAEAAAALQKSKKSYGLILLDLDDLKRINDEHGHDVGDEVLKLMGKILIEELRSSSDMAARLGGQEFGVLCFGDINEQSLHDVAERIRGAIGKECFAAPKGLVRFTGSFGLALAMADDADWKNVYTRADAALREAKGAGKDRISFGRSQKSATARLRALSAEPPTA